MSALRRTTATLVLALVALTCSAPLWAPVPARAMGHKPRRIKPDTSHVALDADSTKHALAPRESFDSLRTEAEAVSDTASDTASAAPAETLHPMPVDSLKAMGFKADSSGAILTRTAPAPKRGAGPPDPPYRIEADRMSGGRGPSGDVLFLEQVHITRGRTRLSSDRGRYERATGMVFVEGKVRVRDSSTTVTCDEATFSETQDRLDLKGNVVVVDHDATLKAPYGWYDRKLGLAQLKGGVRGSEKKQRLVAKEAYYDRDSMLVKARGDVVGYDDENRTQLEAQSVDFDRAHKIAVATGKPLLRTKDEDGKETLLRARLLRVNSLTKLAEALDSVTVERDTLRASAQYARFDDKAGHGILLGNPRAWDGETVMTGDTIETYTALRKLQRITVRSGATIDYAASGAGKSGETSRLTGTQVDMYVSESRIDSLMATGAARNAYTAAPKDGKTAETNAAKGDTILVFFKDKKIDRARVLGGATGEYRPPVAVDDTSAARNERVVYQGRRIDFVIPKNQIVLDGEAELEYRELKLRARKVAFDSQKNTLVAEGQPQLVEKGDQVDGQLMTYDMERKVGTIYQATTAYERGLYHGKQIRKVNDNELDVLGGAYSTCDLAEPHYHFAARWMKIYLKDKLVAKPVVFYIRNVPILALPFYVFPIKPGRHSGFLFPQFEFGFNNRNGQFLRNAGYYWAPNDYFDFTGAGDYYQADPSWLLRGELNYKLLYRFDGHSEMRFGHNDATNRDDYTFSGSHQQSFGQRTRLSALGNFTSSREFNNSGQSGNNFDRRFDRFLNSNLQLTHYADWISLSALYDRRQDLNADDDLLQANTKQASIGVTGRNSLTTLEPSVSVSLPQRTIGSYGFIKDTPLGKGLNSTYLSLSARYLGFRSQRGVIDGVFDTAGVFLGTKVRQDLSVRRGAQSTFALQDSRRLFGWINLSPQFSGNAAVFDHDVLGRQFATATTWQTSAVLSTTLYRTLTTPVAGLAFRHVVSPQANISYTPEFPGLSYRDSLGFLRPRFQSFGDISVFSGRRSVFGSFVLDQRIQAKYTRGDKVTRLDNLFSWNTSGSYDFLWKENGRTHGLQPLSAGFRLQPPGYLNADGSASIDVYNDRPLRSFGYSVYTTFSNRGGGKPQTARGGGESDDAVSRADEAQTSFKDNWSTSLSFIYQGGYFTPAWSASQTINASFRYQLTENWLFDYSTGFDLTRHKVNVQRFNLTRNIHCWAASFSRSFTPLGEAEYYFRLGIREQREIYVERGTRVQSFGGIQ